MVALAKSPSEGENVSSSTVSFASLSNTNAKSSPCFCFHSSFISNAVSVDNSQPAVTQRLVALDTRLLPLSPDPSSSLLSPLLSPSTLPSTTGLNSHTWLSPPSHSSSVNTAPFSTEPSETSRQRSESIGGVDEEDKLEKNCSPSPGPASAPRKMDG